MLCPEVWNFTAPDSSFSTEKLQPNDDKHFKIINNFAYNHLVSIVLPDTLKVPESLTLSNDCDFYKISSVKLGEFVTKDFLQNFVLNGSLHVLSVGTRIDCDDCFAITGQGSLILNVSKATYQTLGLDGAVSHFHSSTSDKYIITVDLKANAFKPGKANYEKTKACLDTLSQDVIVAWQPPKEDVCPSSVAKYFHDNGYKTQVCEVKHKSHLVYSVKVPTLTDENHYDFVEWLGMIALECNLTDGAPDNYVTSYETPEPNEETGQVKFLQWRGFFTAKQITNFYQQFREFVSQQDLRWGSIYVQGFSDSCVAWLNEEHHFYTNGDNSYTFIVRKEDSVACVQKCSRKRYNNKRKGKPL